MRSEHERLNCFNGIEQDVTEKYAETQASKRAQICMYTALRVQKGKKKKGQLFGK